MRHKTVGYRYASYSRWKCHCRPSIFRNIWLSAPVSIQNCPCIWVSLVCGKNWERNWYTFLFFFSIIIISLFHYLVQACFFDPFSANLVSVFAKTLSFFAWVFNYFPKAWEESAKFIEILAYFDTNYFTQCTNICILLAHSRETHIFYGLDLQILPKPWFFPWVIEFFPRVLSFLVLEVFQNVEKISLI